MKNNYKMDITGVFHLSRGKTAIAGKVKGYETQRIINSKAQLVVNGKPQTIITGLYETIFDRPTRNGLRALETSDSIDLTQDFVDTHDCKLVEVETY